MSFGRPLFHPVASSFFRLGAASLLRSVGLYLVRYGFLYFFSSLVISLVIAFVRYQLFSCVLGSSVVSYLFHWVLSRLV